MLRLGIPDKPRWIDLGDVCVHVRPLTTAIEQAAQIRAAREAVKLGTEAAAVRDAGGQVVDLPDLSDPAVQLGVGQMLFIQSLAAFGIIEWTGVGDAEGRPAPVTPENIAEFIRRRPAQAARFAAEYLRPLDDVAAEGNASGPAPNGSSAAGPTTAATAAN